MNNSSAATVTNTNVMETKQASDNLSLVIDPQIVSRKIKNYIRELVDSRSAAGVIIGLSGGIDSALLATLAVRVLGAERVLSYHLYDRDSEKQSRRHAKLMADWLGIELKFHNITSEMRKHRIYSSTVMQLMRLSAIVNHFFNAKLHRLLRVDSPFVRGLRRQNRKTNKIRNFFHDLVVGKVEAAFNARHIYRRKFLEQKAKETNHLVLGAANRSEYMVGWFVKNGIDDMPHSPIVNLYKTQVRQLACFLNLPTIIQLQTPSPDMAKGITDESAIGISYSKLDIILSGIDCNLSDHQLINSGISAQQISHVRSLNKLSAWKRTA